MDSSVDDPMRPDGKVKSLLAKNPGSDTITTVYTYDNRRNLTRETLQVNALTPWTFDYAYNGNGHLSSQTRRPRL